MSFPNNKLKVIADDKIKVTKKLKFAIGRVENIVEKGESAGSSIFSFSYKVFKRNLPHSR